MEAAVMRIVPHFGQGFMVPHPRNRVDRRPNSKTKKGCNSSRRLIRASGVSFLLHSDPAAVLGDDGACCWKKVTRSTSLDSGLETSHRKLFSNSLAFVYCLSGLSGLDSHPLRVGHRRTG